MPLIDVTLLEGVYSSEEKADLIRELTDALGRVGGAAMREATSVRIHEIRDGNWGYAGNVYPVAEAKALKAKG